MENICLSGTQHSVCPVSVKLLAFWGDSVRASIVAQLIGELLDQFWEFITLHQF